MTSTEKKGVIGVIAFFILLVIMLFFTMERSSTTNTFDDNPLVNQMPRRANP